MYTLTIDYIKISNNNIRVLKEGIIREMIKELIISDTDSEKNYFEIIKVNKYYIHEKH